MVRCDTPLPLLTLGPCRSQRNLPLGIFHYSQILLISTNKPKYVLVTMYHISQNLENSLGANLNSLRIILLQPILTLNLIMVTLEY